MHRLAEAPAMNTIKLLGSVGSAASGALALIADAPAQTVGAILGVVGSVAVPCLVAWIARRAEVQTVKIKAMHDARIATLEAENRLLRARLPGPQTPPPEMA